MIQETDQFTLGIGIDPKSKVSFLEVSITALEGTSLAKELTASGMLKTNFGGFIQPDGAVTFNFAGPISPDDAAQGKNVIVELKKKALAELENDPNLDANSRPIAREVLDSLFSVLSSTVEAGKLDGGAVLMLNEKSLDFAAGIQVGNGKKVDEAFRKLIDLAKKDPEAPSVKLDAFKHAGITFHKITAKIPEDREEDARAIFGDKIEVYLGSGESSLYVAFGKKSEALLKRVIDQSTSVADQNVPPMRLTVALLPFLKFAQSIDENADLEAVIKVLEENVDSGDKIRITSAVIPRGAVSRFELDEGIVKAIGAAAKNAGLELPKNFELPNAQ